MNPDTNETQPVEDFLNGENNERAGLLSALTEAIIRFMVSLGAPVDTKATRRLPANGYKAKDAVKATMMGKVARFVGIKAKTVTPFDLMRSGVHRIHLMVNGVPKVINTADRVMLDALAATRSVCRRVRVCWRGWRRDAASRRRPVRAALPCELA